MRRRHYRLFIYILLLCLLPAHTYAQEDTTEISAGHLEYIPETDTYTARGSVKIRHKGAVLRAEKVSLNNTTGELIATGNVLYEEEDSAINAERIELNIKTGLGTIYNGEISYKPKGYRIRGESLRRVEKDRYLISRATTTTCNARPPEWHITGRQIEIRQDRSLKARDVTFYIRDIPVFYIPYLWAPLIKGRQTGLLSPVLGYSSTKGLLVRQGFFWAISQDRDLSLYLDYYSKKGIGEGMDYRYIQGPGTNGEVWVYHMRDRTLDRDLFEFKGYHNLTLSPATSGYLKLHLVNDRNYYRILDSTSKGRFGLSAWRYDPFGNPSSERLRRYLQSNIQLSRVFRAGRLYILSTYRQPLTDNTDTLPQPIPELGLIINTVQAGPIHFNTSLRATDIWRKNEGKAQRLSVQPDISLSLKGPITFTQRFRFKKILYRLNGGRTNPHTGSIELQSTLHTWLIRRYSSLTHTVESSLQYRYIPPDHSDIPILDTEDLNPHTSLLTYSVDSRLSGTSTHRARFRLIQGYDLLNHRRPFTPLKVDASLSGRSFRVRLDASYDLYRRAITETVTSVSFRQRGFLITIGRNLRQSTSLDQYSIEAGITDPINIRGAIWYDPGGRGLQELNIRTTYTSQCWGITLSLNKTPSEYRIMLGISLRGLGSGSV